MWWHISKISYNLQKELHEVHILNPHFVNRKKKLKSRKFITPSRFHGSKLIEAESKRVLPDSNVLSFSITLCFLKHFPPSVYPWKPRLTSRVDFTLSIFRAPSAHHRSQNAATMCDATGVWEALPWGGSTIDWAPATTQLTHQSRAPATLSLANDWAQCPEMLAPVHSCPKWVPSSRRTGQRDPDVLRTVLRWSFSYTILPSSSSFAGPHRCLPALPCAPRRCFSLRNLGIESHHGGCLSEDLKQHSLSLSVSLSLCLLLSS